MDDIASVFDYGNSKKKKIKTFLLIRVNKIIEAL